MKIFDFGAIFDDAYLALNQLQFKIVKSILVFKVLHNLDLMFYKQNKYI